MGIEGLQALLGPIERQMHLKDYAGKTVAIDGLYILHHSNNGATTPLIKGTSTNTYITRFMQYIYMLKNHGVTPMVIFDGLPLPTKNSRIDEPAERHVDGLRTVKRQGHRAAAVAAEKHSQQGIFSNNVIRNIILKLRKKDIQCIVAPYEANAQLTYLEKTKKVEAIISDNLDLIVFGCSKLIYKLDRLGKGVEINQQDIFTSKVSFSLRALNLNSLRQACIASGCDYLPSLRGVSLNKSIHAFKRYNETEKALSSLKSTIDKEMIPTDYNTNFQQANLAFLYQWVYDMDKKAYVRLNPVPEGTSDHDFDFLGKKPAVKGLSLLRMKKTVTKKRVDDVEEPSSRVPPNHLATGISTQVIDYADTIKENLLPSNHQMTAKVPFATNENRQYLTDTSAKGSKRRNDAKPSEGEKNRSKRRVLSSL